MKNKFLFLLLLTFLLIPFKANALTDANSIKNIYYYWTEAGEKVQTSYNGLANNSVTNIVQIGSFDSLVSTNTEFTGMNFSSGDNVYVKVIFTFWHDGDDRNKPNASQINLDNFSTIVSMRPIKTNGEVDWGIQYPTTNVSSFFKNYSNYTEVTVSFNVPVKSSGIGFRLSWGDNNTTSSGYLYNNHTLYPVRFGMTRLQYQIVQDSNNVIIDQNQTIIDQNNKTNEKLDDLNEKQEQTNEELGELNDNITDSTTENPSSKFQEFENMLPENGVITQLITLPISLFQKVLNSINGSCREYNLGNLLGTNLKLPCINISNYVGSTIWNVIDILFSGFFVLTISKKMIKIFNNFSSMEEGDVLD